MYSTESWNFGDTLEMLVGEKMKIKTKFWAVYKTGTGTRGRGYWDACVETLGLGNARRESWGHQIYGTWGRGRSNTGTRGCE